MPASEVLRAPMTASKVRLQLTQPASVDRARARRLFADGALTWLGDPRGTAGCPRRVATDLCLAGRRRRSPYVLRNAVLVELGPPQELGGRLRCEISWRSATLGAVSPVFTGFLTARPGQLHLEGYYTLPGGVLGRVLDRAFFNVATYSMARRLLDRIAAALAA